MFLTVKFLMKILSNAIQAQKWNLIYQEKFQSVKGPKSDTALWLFYEFSEAKMVLRASLNLYKQAHKVIFKRFHIH